VESDLPWKKYDSEFNPQSTVKKGRGAAKTLGTMATFYLPTEGSMRMQLIQPSWHPTPSLWAVEWKKRQRPVIAALYLQSCPKGHLKIFEK